MIGSSFATTDLRGLRVLHCPADVGGHPTSLARAERELGLDSVCVLLDGTGMRRELQRWRLLRRAFREFDVVHFNFGSTLLPRWWPSVHHGKRALYGVYARTLELRDAGWLRRAGKAVFVTFQGDDARTADALRSRVDDTRWLGEYYDRRDDARKRRAAAQLAAVADGVFVLNPDLLALLPEAKFVPYASVDPREYTPVPPATRTRPVVLHAPTDRRAKGTQHVLAAVEQLGDVDLRLVEGVPRAEVRRELEAADVYVDQVLLGWYGGTAVEAMALGRPAIAHLNEDDLARVPREMRADLPVVPAKPATLAAAIRDALAQREELARRGRAFVERWHDPLRIAERTAAAYGAALATRR